MHFATFGCRWLCAVLLSALCVGCVKTPEELFANAQASYAKGERQAAFVAVKNALQAAPDNGEMRLLLGKLYNEAFDGLSAEAELRRAQSTGLIKGGEVVAELARALTLQGNAKKILADVVPSDAFEPRYLARIYALRGRAQFALGQRGEARQSLEQAIKADANQPDVVLLQAGMMAAENNLQGALAAIEASLQRFPGHFEGWTFKAALLKSLGRDDDVLKVYKRILELNPRHGGALAGRATMLMAAGKLDEAQKDVDALAKLIRNNPIALTLQGLLQLHRGKVREALSLAQQALKRDPKFPQALLLAGVANVRLEAPLQALKDLTAYRDGNPHSVFAARTLATVHLELNQPTRTLEILEPFLRREVADPKVLVLAAVANQQLGRTQLALQWFDKATEADPKSPSIRIGRGYVRLAAGNVDAALSDLESAVAESTVAGIADETLIVTYLARGEIAKAAAAVDSLMKRAPDDPVSHNMRALLLMHQRKPEEARKSLEIALQKRPAYFPAAQNLAKLDMAQGDFDSARRRYEAVLAADKGNLQAGLALSELDVKRGRRREAVETLQQVLAKNPTSTTARSHLVNMLMSSGDAQRARTLAEEGLTLDRDQPDAILLAAVAQRNAGAFEQAVSNLGRFVSLYPKSPEGYYELARTYVAMAKYQDAESILRKGLHVAPRDSAMQLDLVALMVRGGRGADALAHARSVQKSQPKSILGFILEAQVHESQNRPQEAVSAYRKALSMQPDSGIAAKLFVIRTRSGDAQGALSELETWVSKHPTFVQARMLAANTQLSNGQFKHAAEHYEAILKSSPGDVAAMSNLALAYERLKDPRSLPTAERAYKLDPFHPGVANILGYVLTERGDPKRAIPLLMQALEATPENLEARFDLATALKKAGRVDEARKELAKIVAAGDKFPKAKEAAALLQSLK